MVKLELFLYLLLRDELPAGLVERLVIEVEKYQEKQPVYSNLPLAEYAKELTERLVK